MNNIKWYIVEGEFSGNLTEGLIETAPMRYKIGEYASYTIYYGTITFNHCLLKKLKVL